MLKTTASAMAIAALTLFSFNSPSAAERVESGKLECDISKGVGVIIGVQQELNCMFKPSNRRAEVYKGKIDELGISIGEITKAKMTWFVYAPTNNKRDALAGTYVGISADAAVGHGLGTDILVGGESGTVSLQPISIKTEEGLNVAAGVTALTLRPRK